MKFNNILLLFVILLVGVLSFSVVSADNVNDVAISNDEGNFSELQDIVSDGGIVFLDKNYKAVENETTITISKNTLINGYNHIIDANGYCGIFNVNDGVTLTLKNLTLQNAYSFDKGGAINTIDGQIILKDDMSFINNNAISGGAIYSESSISIDGDNIEFINNTAYNGWGGAINSQYGNLSIIANNLNFYNNNALYNGGAIYTNESILNIKSKYALFNKNSAGWSGGAIYAINNTIIDVEYLIFSSNIANDGCGGAICVFGTNGITIIAKDVQFNNNVAFEDGGAICAGYITLKIKSELVFNNNKAYGDEYGGGALDAHYGNLNIDAFKVSFVNNYARNNGGAILFESNGKLRISAELINFINNSAKNGGAIYSNGTVTTKFTIFENNTAKEYGGAIYSNWTNIEIKDSYFINNNAIHGGAIYALFSTINLRHNVFSKNSARNGAGIYALNTTVYVNYIYFNENIASKVGGAIALLEKSNAFVVESSFSNNYAMDGSVIMESVNTYCEISNSIFNNNMAEDTGSISIEYSSILNIKDSSFDSNKAINGAAISIEYNSNAIINGITCINNIATTGGAIDICGNCNVEVNSSTFVNNKAGNGGAICAIENCILSIIDSRFNYNNASSGGAISIKDNCTLYSISCIFNGNKGSKGGAIVVDLKSYATIFASNFNSNVGNEGGAIKVSQFSELFIDTVEFFKNDATTGGAIKCTSNSNILVNTSMFDSNVGNDGGSIYCGDNSSSFIYMSIFVNNDGYYGGAISNYANLFVYDSIFKENEASHGGAIDSFMGFSIIKYSIFINNTAYLGAAIFNGANDTEIIDCFFEFNFANYDGGAINNIGNLNIKDSSFKNNFANRYGGAINNYQYSNITASVFANNKDVFNTSIFNNEAIIYLNQNIMDNYTIFNYNGFINSATNIIVLNNETINPGEFITLKALITDDNGNRIYDLREITFDVNGTLINGTFDDPAIFTTDKTGIYFVFATYSYSNSTMQTIVPGYINVEDDYKLTVNDVLKYYGDSNRLIISLTKAGIGVAGEKVTISINGKTYTRITDEDGEINFSINLNVGEYTAIVSYNNLTEEATVTVLSTIYGEDIVKTYQNDTQYYAYFTDSEGNALVNTNVTFNINGVFYTRCTNEKGVAKLNINLLPGDYILTAYNPETGQSFSNNIKVLPILIGNDLIKNSNEKASYEVIAYDSQGKILTGVDIEININGVIYHRITDSNGIAKLNINLNIGEYIVTAYFNGFVTSNKITVI